MLTTKLQLQDKLPLTCSRTGTCCHGKAVWLNPWELHCLAREKKIPPRQFRDLFTEFGGIRLKFDGKLGYKDQQACSQYVDDFGCSVHLGRPLACRLYPLGRQIQSEKVHYIYEGNEFPCLEGCPIVTQLPLLTVGEYLSGQETEHFEKAQDAYLDIMQNLADIAFELLLDTSLAASGDKKTLALWRKMGNELPEELATRIGHEWLEALMLPEITDAENSIPFAQQHNQLLQSKAQTQFGVLQTNQELHEASVLIMGVALHLARGLGADPKALAEHWIEIAKANGAIE
jgi:Fe-S-cluster containining protein